MKRALDLFSGTGSWKKVMKKTHHVISVDITDYKGKFIPTHKVDILTWDYKIYPKDHFDMISAGCPCIWYSILQRSWLGRYKRDKVTKEKYLYTQERYEQDLEYSDRLVLKTLEIIKYFSPRLWFIENPATSLLKTRPFMKDLPYYDVDYCSYGFLYKKSTRIWTNKKDFKPKRCAKDNCPSIIQYKNKRHHLIDCSYSTTKPPPRVMEALKSKNKHMLTTGSWGNGIQKGVGSGNNRLDRYRVPQPLIEDLVG
jgi:hypothetical protein